MNPQTRIAFATTLGILLTSPADLSAQEANWPRFRGPDGMGVSAATKLPTSWDQDSGLLWKVELPGGGSSSPIVFGQHIYLTSYTGYLEPGGPRGDLNQLARHLLCLDRTTGELIWQKTIQASLPEEEQIRDHGYAANTAAADDEGVVVFLGRSGVFAFDHDGNAQWQASAGTGTHGWGTSSSPLLHQGTVYINASVESESLVALDRRTGTEKWRLSGVKESWNTPLIVRTADGREELVLAKLGKVMGIDPHSGKELWNCDTDITWYMVPTAVSDDGIVYYLGGRSGITALAVRTGGSGDVTASHRLWTSTKGSNVTSPIYRDGHLYWMHEKLGIAYCAVAETGELVYEERISRAGQIYASPILANGKIYYTNRSGRTFVVEATPEFRLISTNELRDGSLFNASPAVSGNSILIRSEKNLYCIGQ